MEYIKFFDFIIQYLHQSNSNNSLLLLFLTQLLSLLGIIFGGLLGYLFSRRQFKKQEIYKYLYRIENDYFLFQDYLSFAVLLLKSQNATDDIYSFCINDIQKKLNSKLHSIQMGNILVKPMDILDESKIKELLSSKIQDNMVKSIFIMNHSLKMLDVANISFTYNCDMKYLSFKSIRDMFIGYKKILESI